MEEHIKLCSETLVGRHSLRDLDTDGRIILKCILVKQGVMLWTIFKWFRLQTNRWYDIIITCRVYEVQNFLIR